MQEAVGTSTLEANTAAPTSDTDIITERKSMTDAEAEDTVARDIEVMRANLADESDSQPIPYELSEDEAVFLLKAMFIRAKAGGSVAADLDEVKKRLLP